MNEYQIKITIETEKDLYEKNQKGGVVVLATCMSELERKLKDVVRENGHATASIELSADGGESLWQHTRQN